MLFAALADRRCRFELPGSQKKTIVLQRSQSTLCKGPRNWLNKGHVHASSSGSVFNFVDSLNYMIYMYDFMNLNDLKWFLRTWLRPAILHESATLRTETITISLRGLMRSIWPAFFGCSLNAAPPVFVLHCMPHKSGEIWLSKCKIIHLHFLSFWIFRVVVSICFPWRNDPRLRAWHICCCSLWPQYAALDLLVESCASGHDQATCM